MIAELEALRKQRMEIAFIVDDNLIGNKKAIKALLRDLAAWQTAEGYPFTFFTEASLDLAEDEELMQLMVDGQHRDRLHRHREPERRIAARDEEVSKRPKRPGRSSTASAKCKTPASKSGAA